MDGEETGSSPAYTPTPFLPLANTPTARVQQTESAADALALLEEEPGRTRDAEILSGGWQGLDFRDGKAMVRVTFFPSSALVNLGRPVAVGIQPGWPCAFDDHRACVNLLPGDDTHAPVLFTTVHSGVGGEGDAIRNALEGTGLDRAGFALERIERALGELQGSPVKATQGDHSVEGLQVLAAARIPPAQLEAYFNGSARDGLDLAAEASPALTAALRGERPILIIETCGWRHPEEVWAPTVTDTTGSIYLLVIGQPSI